MSAGWDEAVAEAQRAQQRAAGGNAERKRPRVFGAGGMNA